MIWVGLTFTAAALCAIARSAGKRRDCRALLYVVFGLLGVQLWKHLPMEVGSMWLAYFGSWLVIAGAVSELRDNNSKHIDVASVLLVLVSLCYGWGWVAGMPFGPYAPQLLYADILGLLAWFTMGGPSLVSLALHRNNAMGRNDGGCSMSSDFRLRQDPPKSKEKKVNV